MWEIKGKNNVVKATVNALEYNDEWMGECYVSVSIESPTPINFETGDYLIYRDERFEINYDPSVIKSAHAYFSGAAFSYENIKLNSYREELLNCDFLDIVPEDNQFHLTGLPKFSFFASSVRDLVGRMQANLDRAYGKNVWEIRVEEKFVGKKDVNVVIDNKKIWGGLEIAYKNFEANFIIHNRIITIGNSAAPVSDKILHWGPGNGLAEIGKSAASDQSITTRLRAYGSTRNLPHRYYNLIGEFYGRFEIAEVEKNIIGENGDGADLYVVRIRFISTAGLYMPPLNGNTPSIYNGKLKNSPRPLMLERLGKDDGWFYVEGGTGILGEYADMFSRGEMVIINNNLIPAQLPISMREYINKYLPDNMAVQNLMLPGFPSETRDPHIDSPNIDKYGVRENTIFFDGSGDLEEIFPSLEGMTAEDVRAAGYLISSSGALDVVVSAVPITDDGVGSVNGTTVDITPSEFEITIKDLGFNLKDYFSEEKPKISFKSGLLAGREFEIVKCQDNGSTVKLECLRAYDSTIQLFFPYKDCNVAPGDKLVLVDIGLPEVYVKAASVRLKNKASEWLGKNDHPRISYTPKLDEIEMARQHDRASMPDSGEVSVHDTIKAGMTLPFKDEDLGINESVVIDKLTIKEDDSLIPTYDLTLREEKVVGLIARLQAQIAKGSTNAVYSTGGNVDLPLIKQEDTTAPSDRNVFSALRAMSEFISSRLPQTIRHLWSFLGGLRVSGGMEADKVSVTEAVVTPTLATPGFAPGMSGAGAAMTTDAQGRTHITADFLTARQGMTVTVMTIEELKSTDGGVVISKANGEVERVSEYTNSSGAVVMQLFIRDAATTSAGLQRLRFRTGDFVRCSRTDLSAGTPQRSYWVQVDGVSPGDGSLHILKSRFGEYGTLPLPDDTLVLMGSATDPDRRGCIYIATDSSGEHITVLSGINTPSLEGCQRVRLGSLEGLMLAGELMHGYGLASDNCYLAGRFKLASSGRDVEDEIGSTVRDLASGGVNLLTGTRDFSGWELHESAERPGEYQGAVRLYGDASGATAYRDLAQAAFRFEADTEYTLSFYGWGSRIQTYCYPGLGSVIGANSGTAASGVTRNDTMCEFILGGTPERHYVTFRTASSGIPATGWVLFRIPATEDAGIAGVKLERGGLMTPWSLAPGDTAKIEDSVTTLRGEVEATNAGFLSEFSKTTEYIDGEIDRVESSIEQTAEKISLKVERTAQGGANLLAGSYTGEALGHWWQGGGTWETRPADFDGYGLTVRSAGADIAVSLRDGSNNAIFTPEIPAGTDIVLGLDVSRVTVSINAPKPVVTAALHQGGQTASGTIYGEAQIPGGLAASTRVYITLRTTVAAKLGLTLQIKNVPAGTLVTLSDIMMESGTVAHAFSPLSSDPADLIRRLKATGIDIMEGSVTVTADRVTFEDNAGNEQAIIQNGKFRAELIDTDTLTARRLVATAPDGTKRASLNESGDGMYRIYDPDGGYRIAEYGVAEVTVRSKSVLTIARGYGADGTLTWYQTPRGEILDPSHIPYTVETIRCAGPFASVADMQKPVTLGPVKELYVLRIDTQAYPEAAELDGRTATRNTYEAFADDSEYLAEAGEYGSPEFGSATLGNTTTYSRQRYMVDDSHMLAETGTTMWIRNNGSELLPADTTPETIN